MNVAAKVYYGRSHARRAAERTPLSVGATIRGSGEGVCDAAVHDLSTTGCQLATEARLTAGAAISIGVAGLGVVPATVVRRVGDRYGCRFLSPVDQAAVDAAQTARTVVPFDGTLAAMDAAPPPDIARWPLVARAALIVGGASLCWAAIGMLLA